MSVFLFYLVLPRLDRNAKRVYPYQRRLIKTIFFFRHETANLEFHEANEALPRCFCVGDAPYKQAWLSAFVTSTCIAKAREMSSLVSEKSN